MPAECYFLDVGQGTSQVILLGNGRGIVIDCGPASRIPLLLLKRYVTTLAALIVTHNDADHQRGALQILTEYGPGNAIERMYFLQDRPVDRIGFYAKAAELYSRGAITHMGRLERDPDKRILCEDQSAGITLEVLYPRFADNLQAQSVGLPNATSGVIALFCGTRRLVFPGDAPIEAFRVIHEEVAGPVLSDVLAVSHHGGVIWPRQQRREKRAHYEARVRHDLDWLYSEAFKSDHAVVSVGTSNRFDHPRQWVVQALRKAGSVVLCTQITDRCTQNLEEARRNSIRSLARPSRSSAREELTHRTRRSKNVGCAGTVVVAIRPDKVDIDRIQEHQAGVDRLVGLPAGHPLCRSHSAGRLR